ncbi:MAG TPA: alanine--tRNA ligase [Chitinophagaceae bacterium]|nr:alanine--tRNA ligase [Chitinophagaceae bacterium]
MTASEIRKVFFDFFISKQHQIVDSAPIVVKNDPTLLFTNSGMNQFKDYFLGTKTPKYKRVADTQKCLRVSGKHNDLEEVGVDTYHHTMFEMLGNWSFGDYFKAEAIAWSWELLTEVYKIPKEDLYVTVFEGDPKENLPFDQESYDEWKKWIPEDRILKGSKEDNFWEMGDIGPCGPCSEIHVDCRTEEEKNKIDARELINEDHPQVIEIWNNVFMEFNRQRDGKLLPLPEKHVDTGMGFERLVRVLQKKQSNYDTDVFLPLIQEIEKLTRKKYEGSDSLKDIAFRVVADHIRAVAFTIADGQLPSNVGAGYVIRRILRRAVRYYYSHLGYEKPLIHQMIPFLSESFKGVFDELYAQIDFVSKVILEEEESFLRTLDKGLHKMDILMEKHQKDKIIPGEEAFELYDTYGFPLDLTTLIASEYGINVDLKGFEKSMEEQKNRSRAATTFTADDWQILDDGEVEFVGYEDLLEHTKVLRYRTVRLKGDKVQFHIVLEKTPFYPEGGGQIGDQGSLIFDEEEIKVINTFKENDVIIQQVAQFPKKWTDEVSAKVDFERRLNTTYNHSATHLLHAALRKVLGEHVAQKGSYVGPDSLRFDFSHIAKMKDDEIREVEKLVNAKIRENIPVKVQWLSREEADKKGAMALFGEKYGEKVRVVTMDDTYSIELCGGTHVNQTGMIGVFVITQETSVSAGIRRIEALTGAAAIQYVYEKVQENKEVVNLLKTKNPLQAVAKLLEDKQQLEKRIQSLLVKENQRIVAELNSQFHAISTSNGTVEFLAKQLQVEEGEALKSIANDLVKKKENPAVVVLVAKINDKAQVAIGINDAALEKGFETAPNMMRQWVSKIIRGGGGGSKNLAAGGGQDSSRLEEVLNTVKKSLEE